VTSSGERDYSTTKGAQAAAVRDALVRILTRVPEADETENTPFGPAYHKKGVQIWKTLWRDEDDPMYNSTLRYLDQILEGIPKETGLRFAGLDRVTGKQMMYVAWKELSPLPIVIRAAVVPEMGNKARIVTLAPYWVNVLQAPLAHLLVDALRLHPSAFSSFARQDQAWDACRRLVFSKNISFEDDQAVLSSDLSGATNTQQFEITKVMLESFIQGYTGSIELSAYVKLVLGTIGPRAVLLDELTTVISTTGIMMGEAIAKPSLTLLNLSIEELAYLEYNNALDRLNDESPAPLSRWRFFHVGGDDHLAKGPKPYLNLITSYHLKAGSRISPDKHGLSKICVKYCERLINLENLQYCYLYEGGPRGLSSYRMSAIVDSVKVRLLERGLSTRLKKDDKNVAIGKSSMLVKVLEWLPIDNIHYTYDKIVSIRNLFINRMGPLLPSRVLHPRAYAAVHLPKIFGGYGLGFDREIYWSARLSPEPTQHLIFKMMMGADISADIRIFSKLNTNVSQRGVAIAKLRRDELVELIEKYPEHYGALDWDAVELKFKGPGLSNRETLYRAKRAGILSVRDYAEWTVRGDLFQNLLLGVDKLNIFNSTPYTRTYQKIWDECEDTGLFNYKLDWESFTNDDIIIMMNKFVPQTFIDINQEVRVDIGFQGDDSRPEEYEFVTGPIKDMFTKGYPDLLVGKTFIGCDSF
jgi:hypothetical protein